MDALTAARVALEGAMGADLDADTADFLALAAEGLVEASKASGHPLGEILLKALPLLPDNMLAGDDRFARRSEMEYEARGGLAAQDLTYVSEAALQAEFCLSVEVMATVVRETNRALLALELFGSVLRVSIAELLQLRNLSGLVGEVVVSELERHEAGQLFRNPHQDGYPDLLALTPNMQKHISDVKAAGRMSDKEAWTNPGFGGVEVKATVGNTVPASVQPKPGLGEERSALIKTFDWKAHHRETQRLLAVIWDFVDGVPTLSAIYFRNDLTEADWGKLVTPKAGGGRTTSVSVMPQAGVKKLASGWLVRTLDEGLRRGLDNGGVLV